MKRASILLYITVSGFIIAACATESTPVFTLNTSVIGEGSITPERGEYKKGEKVILTANPIEHWSFDSWSGDATDSSDVLTLTMDSDKSILGIFTKNEYSISINIEGYGEVEKQIIQGKSSQSLCETIVKLTPISEYGWKFMKWSGDLRGREFPVLITIDGDNSIDITFQREKYPLNITVVGDGTVKKTLFPQKSSMYPFVSVVILESILSNGWEFVEWNGDLSGYENPKLIVVDREKHVTAILGKI